MQEREAGHTLDEGQILTINSDFYLTNLLITVY